MPFPIPNRTTPLQTMPMASPIKPSPDPKDQTFRSNILRKKRPIQPLKPLFSFVI